MNLRLCCIVYPENESVTAVEIPTILQTNALSKEKKNFKMRTNNIIDGSANMMVISKFGEKNKREKRTAVNNVDGKLEDCCDGVEMSGLNIRIRFPTTAADRNAVK